MIKGLVNKILPFSAVDGPGNRTAIFLQGCNFNCLYCHNPETINNSTSYSDSNATWMSIEEVLSKIKATRYFLSGITISGGECMLQSEFITKLCEEVKALHLTTFIDSNGSVPFFGDDRLINAIDRVMLDVKSYKDEEHKKLTGQNNDMVLKNLDYLASVNKLYEVRTVIVPNVLNNEMNVDLISKRIAKLNPNIRYKLIRYRPIGVRTHIIKSHVPSNKLMKELYDIAKTNGCNDIIIV